VISGCVVGIEVDSSNSGNLVQGNRIGTNAAGTAALANTTGVRVGGANTIGGAAPAMGNLISGNSQNGIETIGGAGATQISGNLIGTDVTGAAALGNGLFGIESFGSSTGVIGGPANTIAFNTGSGVVILGPSNFTIAGNSIHSNGGIGIDLNGDGVNPNDPGDPDVGPNGFQNFPVVTGAFVSPARIRIQGTLNSLASQTFHVEFFASPACDPTGFGEGKTFLGFTDVMTDGSGNGTFDVTLGAQVAAGSAITATATGPDGTSEFSACLTSLLAAVYYYPVPPCRVVDTRNPNGPLGGPALVANADRTFVVAGTCGVPASAIAASFNIAVTLGGAGGDLRIFPAGTLLPLVSAINYKAFQTRSNNAIIGLGAAGDITVHTDQGSGTVHLILDVNGYFQ
jgi:hypothetical protein